MDPNIKVENGEDPSAINPLPSVVKEPELVTIIEDKPLTTEQLEAEHELHESYESSCYGPGEATPLLRSGEVEANRSTDFLSFTTSQASLFIPSVQFSLYSSRGHDANTTNPSILSSSRRGSMIGRDSRAQSVNSVKSTRRDTSYSVSILARLAEDGQASAGLALWNVINMINGSGGLLGAPYAIKLGGFPALALILVVGVMTNFAGVLLIDSLYKICPKTKLRKKVRSSYAEIGAACWGPFGGKVVDFMTVSMCYCTSVLFIMMLGSSMLGIVRDAAGLTLTQWCLICTCIVLPTVFIRKLEVLAWLSMLAVVSLLLCTFILIGYSLGEWRKWSIHNIPDFDSEKFPIAIGIIVFGYCGHSVFPGIECSMRKPKQFNKTSYIAFSFVTIIKMALGFVACLLFGGKTNSIVTLNLGVGSVLSMVAVVLVIINVYFSYPLNLFVVTETLDILVLSKLPSSFAKGGKFHGLWLVFTRTALVFITFGIAVSVPNFGLLMGIFGSVLGACISFIFPCVFHLQLKWRYLRWYQRFAEIAVILFGIVAGILGLIYSSLALKNSSSN